MYKKIILYTSTIEMVKYMNNISAIDYSFCTQTFGYKVELPPRILCLGGSINLLFFNRMVHPVKQPDYIILIYVLFLTFPIYQYPYQTSKILFHFLCNNRNICNHLYLPNLFVLIFHLQNIHNYEHLQNV